MKSVYPGITPAIEREQVMMRLAGAVSMSLVLVGTVVPISPRASHPDAVDVHPHESAGLILQERQTPELAPAHQMNKANRPDSAPVGLLEFLAVSGMVVDFLAEGSYPAMRSRR